MSEQSGAHRFSGRASAKLAAALDEFAVSPEGLVCADLGANVGGFTEVLLMRGAARVYSIDTGHGVLAGNLRRDARVVNMERTNALHVTLPEPMDLVVADLGWTQQRWLVPAALALLRPGSSLISLIKPHYESDRKQLRHGVLPWDQAPAVLEDVLARLAAMGTPAVSVMKSPLLGAKGNVEFLARFCAAGAVSSSPPP